jgi:hypothetical protein
VTSLTAGWFVITGLLRNGAKVAYKISCVVYRNGNLFSMVDSSDSVNAVNSLVMAGAVNGMQITNLTEPIKIVFRLKEVSVARR